MKVLLFGATGMVGRGVLLECLDDSVVSSVLVVGRRSVDVRHPKLREILHADFLDLGPIAGELAGHDTCLWCLGVKSTGISEEAYRVITKDYPVHAAEVLTRDGIGPTFCYLSAAGADATGESRMMWARVKGAAESALRAFPFEKLVVFRPFYIQPRRGVKPSYGFYRLAAPFYPVWRGLFPKYVLRTTDIAQAMIRARAHATDGDVLETQAIVALSVR